jgi:sulfur dioxygenase
MLFRQLFDADTWTYTYLLADETTREAILIDPVIEQVERDVQLLKDLDLQLTWVADTHVHADHVTAAGVLTRRLGGKAVLSERAGAVMADRLVKDGDRLPFGERALEVRETPGHTSGCLTYALDGAGMAFTGDALLIRGCGRTDFQQGDAATLYRSVHGKIFTLPPSTALYPGHDYKGRTVTSVDEEVRLNPRLGSGKTEAEFVEIMTHLELAYPKRMDVAVPANLRSGLPPEAVDDVVPSLDNTWGPVAVSVGGVPELTCADAWSRLREVTVVDVREPDEFRGDLGHVPGSLLVPLASLASNTEGLPTDKPLLVVCRSGGRSGKAALELARRGFRRVASLAGGMRAWNKADLPTETGLAANTLGGRQG